MTRHSPLATLFLAALLGPTLPLGTHVRVHVKGDPAWHTGRVVMNDYGCLTVQYDGSVSGVARFPQLTALERADPSGKWIPMAMDSVRAADAKCGWVKHEE
jgi:hypothetical protein